MEEDQGVRIILCYYYVIVFTFYNNVKRMYSRMQKYSMYCLCYKYPVLLRNSLWTMYDLGLFTVLLDSY